VPGQTIDGRAYATDLASALDAEASRLQNSGTRVGLATILVGDRYSSAAYERRLAHLAAQSRFLPSMGR
jgi:methylenetetrahydrofolate dehydrogenase (NADP+)/methenyltetrahydrofolate cyclohydrolase